MRLERIEMLNDHPLLLSSLAKMVRERVASGEFKTSAIDLESDQV
jgi:hypothetical protein